MWMTLKFVVYWLKVVRVNDENVHKCGRGKVPECTKKTYVVSLCKIKGERNKCSDYKELN